MLSDFLRIIISHFLRFVFKYLLPLSLSVSVIIIYMMMTIIITGMRPMIFSVSCASHLVSYVYDSKNQYEFHHIHRAPSPMKLE